MTKRWEESRVRKEHFFVINFFVYQFRNLCFLSAESEPMIDPEEYVGPEWAEWYRLTPEERWEESLKLWDTYLALGGSLDPRPRSSKSFLR